MSISIPQELIEQLKKGNIVLFCGAGISVSEGGLPGGKQLARELAERAGEPELVNAPLPEVAQAYELKMGHQSLIEYVSGRIDDPHYIPLHTHHLISALPFTKIITTNWDNLLEEALRQAGKPFVKVVRDAHVAFADEMKVLLIKLHGSIEQQDSIVITGDDYYDVFAHLPETANLVLAYFATKTILFLGFGLADEDFKRLYHEVVRHLGKHKRRAYAAQLNPDERTTKYWEQKNVQVINADATAFLEALAEALGEDVVPITPSKPTPSVVRQPRRIDAALPSQAQVGKYIDLVVAVKLSDSPPLAPAEIRAARASRKFPDDATAESRPVEVEFAVDKRTGGALPATLEIQVIAPNFKIHGPQRKSLLVSLDRDSDLCTFPLRPRIPGESEVSVELYSQGALVGSMRLETVVHPDSVPIDRRPPMIWTAVALPVVLIIAPSEGMATATLQLYLAGPPSRYHITEKPLPVPTPLPTPQPVEGEKPHSEEIATPSGKRVLDTLALMVAIATLVVAIVTLVWPDIRGLLFQPMPTATPTSTWTPAPATSTPILTPTPIATSTPTPTSTPILTSTSVPKVRIIITVLSTYTLKEQSFPIECGGIVLLPSSGIILTMADIPITPEQERELHWSALVGQTRPQEGRASSYYQDPKGLKLDVVSLDRTGIRICYFYIVVQQTP